MLMEIAIFASVGLVLDQISFKIVPQGGSISLVMLPIVLIAIRWGVSAGLTTGLLVGILQMMFGGYILHWVQALLDYVVAFSVVGVAGIVRAPVHKAIEAKNLTKLSLYLVLGTALGETVRVIDGMFKGVIGRVARVSGL